MIHIRKKDSSYDPHIAYTLVITDGYGGQGEPALEQHPSMLEHPEIFEIVDAEIPSHYQKMIYISESNP
jgi:hypothetical protein